MHDLLAVEIVESLEDLDDVARDESLGQLSKMLERLLQRSILDVPIRSTSASFSTERREDSLEDDVDVVLRPHESLVLDDSGVSKTLEHRDFVGQLLNLLLALALELYTLDRHDSTRVEVQSSIDGSELASSDAFSELLSIHVSTGLGGKGQRGLT